MSVIKVACSKCGQRVSGDERFYGASVQCPICSAQIEFPPAPGGESGSGEPASVADLKSLPSAAAEPVPQSSTSAQPAQNPGEGAQSNVISMGEPPPKGSADSSAGMVPACVLISGIIAMVSCVGAVVFGPLAIILGHIALIRMNANGESEGKGKTTIGLVLGYLSLLLLLITVIGLKVLWPQLQGMFGSGGGEPDF